jgi:hypothetical protein
MLSAKKELFTPSGGGYQISRSVRLRSSASAYFNRTLTTPTNNKIWTYSVWVKKARPTSNYDSLFSVSDSKVFRFGYSGSDFILNFVDTNTGWYFTTTQVFRDPSAWMHLVLVIDTTNATAGNRTKVYVNGIQVTAFSAKTDPSQNAASSFNAAVAHYIGQAPASGHYFDGYMTETNFIDGQALTPSSFGETNAITGVWQPKEYAGTYGINGFYLNFSDNSAADALGYDSSSGSYSRNLRTSGTNTGTFTANGGLAAAFDGNYNQPNASSARASTPAAGYNTAVIGKDWGSGVTKTITAVQLFAQNDGGFVGGTTTALVFKLQGSNDGSTWTDLTSAITGPATGAGTVITVTSGITTTTAYRYHRINVNADGSNNYYICELAFYEAGAYGLNNWYPNNISVTAGATYDSMIDVPTLYADGGNGRGNYCTLNPLENPYGFTLSAGNLDMSGANAWRGTRATIGVTSGKWYWEYVHTSATAGGGTAISTQDGYTRAQMIANNPGVYPGGWEYIYTGQKANNNVYVAYGAAFTQNDVVGVAFDADAGTLVFYKNGVSQGTAYTGLTSGPYFPTDCGAFGGNVYNFGQRPFAYTPPTGFKALNTQNLPDATIKKGNAYFDVSLWTGDATTPRAVVSNLSFSPDLVWTKDRSVGYQHSLQDTVRGTGASKKLYSSLTEAENGANSIYGHINSFDANGFTVATGSGGAQHVNASGVTYVGWQWDAGTTTVTNTSGSISAQVRANPTAGFSVVTYTGNSTSGATIGHGLGVKPDFMIFKYRGTSIPELPSWYVYHKSYGATQYMYLNSTAALDSSSVFLNNTEPTSTLITLGNAYATNYSSATFVAYCFAAVAGYSAFGSYTGNGSTDGPFVFTGFRPRFVLIKRSNSTGNWFIWDSSRNTYNAVNNQIYPDSSSAEAVQDGLDFLSNGFKIRFSSTFADRNANGGTYIYAAFAENPFKHSLAR